ncbi:MAG: hypothetical protein NVV60_08950 [Luteimonas sp.]|nr:hypothetical protein [Luteimonas sp.]
MRVRLFRPPRGDPGGIRGHCAAPVGGRAEHGAIKIPGGNDVVGNHSQFRRGLESLAAFLQPPRAVMHQAVRDAAIADCPGHVRVSIQVVRLVRADGTGEHGFHGGAVVDPLGQFEERGQGMAFLPWRYLESPKREEQFRHGLAVFDATGQFAHHRPFKVGKRSASRRQAQRLFDRLPIAATGQVDLDFQQAIGISGLRLLPGMCIRWRGHHRFE